MERFQASKAFLEGLSLDDPKGLAAVFVWLRFSQVRRVCALELRLRISLATSTESTKSG